MTDQAAAQPSPLRRILALALWGVPLALCASMPNIGPLSAMAIVIGALIFRRDARQATLQMWWRGPFASIVLGVGAGVVIWALTGTLIEPAIRLATGTEPDLSVWEAVRGNFNNYLVMLAIGIGIGGVLEELVFRGYIVGWGASLFGARWSVLLAALAATAFGLAHLYQGLAGMISTGLIGFMIGCIYVYAGRKLAPAMVAHMTVNILGITELYVGHQFLRPLIGA